MRLLTPSIIGFANMSTLSPNNTAQNLQDLGKEILKRHGEDHLGYHSQLSQLSTLLTSPKDERQKTKDEVRSPAPHIILPPQVMYSPNDLVDFYKSEVISWLTRFRTEQRGFGLDHIQKAKIDESAMLFIDKGIKHEDDYLAQLRAAGKTITEIPTFHTQKGMTFEQSYELTIQAMQEGPEVIYQAALRTGRFAGYADFLIRVDNPPGVKSTIGGVELDYHYEVWDTKLSRSPQPKHILQLCCYADMLEDIQGIRPQHIAVVLGTGKIATLKTNDYFFYYRQLKKMFLQNQRNFDPINMPEIGKGDYFNWNELVKGLRQESDSLSQVAGITNSQIRRLNNAGITTMTELAQTTVQDVLHLSKEIFERLKLQAQLQLTSKDAEVPSYVVQTNEEQPHMGLGSLPPPSQKGMDIFFDIEGYPLREGGLEYLLGAMSNEGGKRKFHTWWSNNAAEEKVSFESFIDWIYDRWQKDPTMHVYHYASYEVSAMLRLASKHGTREKEVDEILKNHVFVDLYKITKQGLIVGTSSYSIKYIEKLYRGQREGEVTNALSSVVEFDHYLETEDPELRALLQQNLEEYNEDDCDSTVDLYEFLYGIQQDHEIAYIEPEVKADQSVEFSRRFDKSKSLPDKDTPKLIAELRTRYAKDIKNQTERGQIVGLITNILNYHAREVRVTEGDNIRRSQMSEDELIADTATLGGLVRTEHEIYKEKRSYIYTYAFDVEQETKLAPGDRFLFSHNQKFSGSVHNIDWDNGLVYLKLSNAQLKKHPGEPSDEVSLIPVDFVPPGSIHDALYQIASYLNQDTAVMSSNLSDLLHRRSPRIIGRDSGPVVQGDVYQTETNGGDGPAIRAVKNMDGSTLFIQGPPGSGKTHMSADMILSLIAAGKRVGITGPSHKAINNLLKKVYQLAADRGIELNGVKIGAEDEELAELGVGFTRSTSDFMAHMHDGIQLVAGTPWAFSNEHANKKFSHVFVDEAGQVPLAHAIAMTWSAKNMVFVGDPEQLPQPVRAKHPGDSGQAVFEYYLNKFAGRQTLPDDAGIFLPKTFRMHPQITEFLSENFYEGRLQSDAKTNDHTLVNPSAEDAQIRSGIHFIAVPHEGNKRSSLEEVQAMEKFIASLDAYLLQETDFDGTVTTRAITQDDVLIVAPYRAQVHLGRRNLPKGTRIGTVDKFQGQEAHVSLISMSNSRPQNALTVSFLMNPNRLNVAMSRAKAVVGIFGSPDLVSRRVHSLKEWKLVNMVCRIMQQFDGNDADQNNSSQQQEELES